MSDYYLKFPDQTSADSALADCGYTRDINGNTISSDGISIDTLGIIYTAGVYDAEGNLVSGNEPTDGWHINIRKGGSLDASLTQYQMFPLTPRRVWA